MPHKTEKCCTRTLRKKEGHTLGPGMSRGHKHHLPWERPGGERWSRNKRQKTLKTHVHCTGDPEKPVSQRLAEGIQARATPVLQPYHPTAARNRKPPARARPHSAATWDGAGRDTYTQREPRKVAAPLKSWQPRGLHREWYDGASKQINREVWSWALKGCSCRKHKHCWQPSACQKGETSKTQNKN